MKGRPDWHLDGIEALQTAAARKRLVATSLSDKGMLYSAKLICDDIVRTRCLPVTMV